MRKSRWLRRKATRRLCIVAIVIFGSLNLLAFTGTYFLTHFRAPGQVALGKPRPTNTKLPSDVGLSYKTQRIPINQSEWLETWVIPAQTTDSLGTVMLFPGNGSSKAAQLLPSVQAFHKMGYDILLTDFRGVGGSSGRTTTLGVREAKDVTIATQYAQDAGYRSPFILYGISMGSVAILKAVAEDSVQPEAIILEQPFSTMVNAVRSRLRAVKAPTFPVAELMVFWGSVQHGFNGFAHNPVRYASSVSVPTLLLQGEQDKWTTLSEIEQLLRNLKGEKQLSIFPEAGHDLLITVDQAYWQQTVEQFLLRL